MKPILLLAAAAFPLGAQSSVPTWTLSPRPTLDIGNDANVHTQFNGVTGLLRMPRGDIVVANGTSQELRIFSPAGTYLRTLAEPGTGRGNLRALNRLWRAGDTIIAAETAGGESNLHLYSHTGFLGSRPVGRANAGSLSPVDRFADGRMLVRGGRRSSRTVASDVPFTDSAMIGVVSLPDLIPNWIATLTSEMIIIPGLSTGRGRMPNIVPYVFGRTEAYAVSGDRLWTGDSETGRIEQYDSQGRKLGQFVAPIAQRPLDSVAIRRQRQSVVNDAMNWNDRARLDASYSAPMPKFAPRFARFIPGAGGEMWVELFSEVRDAPRAYLILDVSGRPKGRVTMPHGVSPFEIGGDYLLGVQKDQDGLEHIVQYTLLRNPR